MKVIVQVLYSRKIITLSFDEPIGWNELQVALSEAIGNDSLKSIESIKILRPGDINY